MNGTLTLKNPVMINGDKITEMKYDTNEIDGVLFATAEAKRKAAAGMKNLSVSCSGRVRLRPPPLPRLCCDRGRESDL